MEPTNIQLPGDGTEQDTLFEFDFHATGGHTAGALLSAPPLAPARAERWSASGQHRPVHAGCFVGCCTDDYLFLHTSMPASAGTLRAASRDVYRELLAQVHTLGYGQLVRIWNYVPDINAGAGDEENYRQFCWGRAEGFDGAEWALPAATGTGSADGRLYISALCARSGIDVRHHENPRQISAYRYPRAYGPRAPSFARATYLRSGERELYLLSGTASIVNHETRHAGCLNRQMEETSRNVASLAALYPHLQPAAVRCYLRHADDQAACLQAYTEHFPGFPAPALLQSALCRDDLLVELEAVFAAPN
jgi:enamine deaminase RidA (YjgF/YER057c/UK114 family)